MKEEAAARGLALADCHQHKVHVRGGGGEAEGPRRGEIKLFSLQVSVGDGDVFPPMTSLRLTFPPLAVQSQESPCNLRQGVWEEVAPTPHSASPGHLHCGPSTAPWPR